MTTQAVRAVLDQLYAAWAANDADTYAKLYREDASVATSGALLRSRTELRDFLATAFAGRLRDSRATDEPLDIRIIGDTAIVVSRSGILMAGEESVPAERARYATWVLVRDDGDWKVAAYANTPA